MPTMLRSLIRAAAITGMMAFSMFQISTAEGSSDAGLAPVPLAVASGPQGHLSIGLASAAGALGGSDLVSFAALKDWDFSPESASSPPPFSVAQLGGRDLSLAGFMFPLQEGEAVRAFLLTATTQTCCYGPRPEYNQFVLVEASEPVPFSRLKPCLIRGRFIIEPRPADGYIFRLEAQEWRVLEVLEQPIVGAVAKIPEAVLDWSLVETLRPEAEASGLVDCSLPASLSRLLGKEVALVGNLVNGVQEASGTWATIASHPWDGCCYGRPPEFADSLKVRLAPSSVVPQYWHKQGRFQGVLREFTGEERQTRNAVLWLDQAQALSLADSFIGGRMASFPASPMVEAAANRDIPGVRLLVRAGVSIEARDPGSNAPVHLAAGIGDVAMLNELFAHGASATVRNKLHETPVHKAAESGHTEAVLVLLGKGVEIDPVDHTGFTPLARAIANGHQATAKILIERGARHDLPTSIGLTPLALAVRYRQPELVQLLAAKGAGLEPVDRMGQTPLGWSLGAGDTEMANLLKSLGATR